MSVHITHLMGSAESSLLGLNSQRETMLLKDLPSHPDKKKYNLFIAFNWVYYIALTRGQFNMSLLI